MPLSGVLGVGPSGVVSGGVCRPEVSAACRGRWGRRTGSTAVPTGIVGAVSPCATGAVTVHARPNASWCVTHQRGSFTVTSFTAFAPVGELRARARDAVVYTTARGHRLIVRTLVPLDQAFHSFAGSSHLIE